MFVKCEHFATLARTQPFNVTVSTNALMLMVSLLGLSFRHFLFSLSFWSLLLILLCRSVYSRALVLMVIQLWLYFMCFQIFLYIFFKLSVSINIASQCCSALVLMVTQLWLSPHFQFCFTAHTLLRNSQLSWQTPKTSLSYGKFVPAPVDYVEAVCNLAIRVMLCAGLSLPHVHIRGGGLPWGILVSTITE